MRGKILVAAGFAVMLGLAGCGAVGTEVPTDGSAAQGQEAAPDFDGSGLSDTGAGTMYLSTAGGTSEGGNVPEIVADEASLVQIGINYSGGDGSECTVYVDGMENSDLTAGEMVQQTLTLEGSALAPGEHLVEVVATDGDEVTLYKSASYSVAG